MSASASMNHQFPFLSHFLLCETQKPSQIIKFRTCGQRPSCVHELEKYWACPRRETGLDWGWVTVNKSAGKFPPRPVEHQLCQLDWTVVNWPRSASAGCTRPHGPQWILGRCSMNINNVKDCSLQFLCSFMGFFSLFSADTTEGLILTV